MLLLLRAHGLTLPATDAEVAAALAGVSGSVLYEFHYYRVDRAGERLQEITTAVLDCTVESDINRDVKKTAKLTVKDEPGIVLNYLTDQIEPVLLLTVPRRAAVEFSYGYYHLTFPTATEDESASSYAIAAMDQTIFAILDKLDDSYTVAAGENIVQSAVDILQTAGFSRFDFPPSVAITATAITWAPGTAKLKVANDLLMSLNYYTIWDEGGVLTTMPQHDLSLRDSAVTYQVDNQSLVLNPIKRDYNQSRFANRVAVIVNDPGRTPFSVIAENRDPTSPISTVNLGYTVQKTVADSSIVDATTAQERALYELSLSASLYTTAQLRTTIDPRRRTNEVYQVSVYRVEADGTQTVLLDGFWHAQKWAVELKIGAEMQHTIARVEPARGTVS